jgi:hypothetical protein
MPGFKWFAPELASLKQAGPLFSERIVDARRGPRLKSLALFRCQVSGFGID